MSGIVDARPAASPAARPPRERHPVAATIAAAVAVTVAVVVVLGSPGPEPAPPVSRGPHGSRVLCSDTISGSNWCGYNRVQNQKYTGPACGYHDTSYTVRSVDGAARFEVRPGDSP